MTDRLSLADSLRRLRDGVVAPAGRGTGGPHELVQRVDETDLLRILPLAGPELPRALFGRRRLGLGTAWQRDGGDLAALDQPGPFATRWLSLRFDPEGQPSDEWAPFGRLRLWTPRLECRPGELRLRLADAADATERGACRSLLESLLARAGARERPMRGGAWRSSGPDERRRWEQRAEVALQLLEGARPMLEKIVLARRRELALRDNPSSTALLRCLAGRERGAWPWLLAWPGSGEFLGATPEWLLKRRGARLSCLSLAGTRARGASPSLDSSLGAELLASEKDLREQALVTDWLEERLGALAVGNPVRQGPELRRLATLQHLESRLEARLPRGLGMAELVRRLHPTPALCGRPRAAARAWLRGHEEDDRGLYGGLLGLLEPGRAELRVAIRGALRRDDTLRVFAGAGFVKGSDPAREWEETGLKLQALASAWGVEA